MILYHASKKFMSDKEKNDLFYVCSLIEYIARQTNNKRRVISPARQTTNAG